MRTAMVYYAHKTSRGEFIHITSDKRGTRMYGSGKIYKVSVRDVKVGEKSPYWGWRDKDGSLSMIYPAKVLLNMCFAYGPEIEEKRGKGKRVNLVVELIE